MLGLEPIIKHHSRAAQNKPRILLVQNNLQPPGGGGCVTAWTVQALVRDYALSILSWKPLRVEEINAFYGTTLRLPELTALEPPAYLRRLLTFDPDPTSYQPSAWLMRWAKQMRGGYALLVHMNNEFDVGGPSLQYVHYPYLAKHFGADKWRFAWRPWRLISGFGWEGMKQNRTLVNSDWTGRRVTEAYGIPTTTLYPPVWGNFPPVPWAERQNGFVCLGRYDIEKKIETVISILAAVRARGYPIHLHLVGSMVNLPADVAYYNMLKQRTAPYQDWIEWNENVSRAELMRLLTQHRYGLHAHPQEHFGIAVAELVRAGCVVFVPNDGGQVEIIGAEERLLYASPDEAVEKIVRVLDDEPTQRALEAKLHTRADLFSVERFMRETRALVDAALAARP